MSWDPPPLPEDDEREKSEAVFDRTFDMGKYLLLDPTVSCFDFY